MKKIIAVFLSVILVFSFAVTIMAEYEDDVDFDYDEYEEYYRIYSYFEKITDPSQIEVGDSFIFSPLELSENDCLLMLPHDTAVLGYMGETAVPTLEEILVEIYAGIEDYETYKTTILEELPLSIEAIQSGIDELKSLSALTEVLEYFGLEDEEIFAEFFEEYGTTWQEIIAGMIAEQETELNEMKDLLASVDGKTEEEFLNDKGASSWEDYVDVLSFESAKELITSFIESTEEIIQDSLAALSTIQTLEDALEYYGFETETELIEFVEMVYEKPFNSWQEVVEAEKTYLLEEMIDITPELQDMMDLTYDEFLAKYSVSTFKDYIEIVVTRYIEELESEINPVLNGATPIGYVRVLVSAEDSDFVCDELCYMGVIGNGDVGDGYDYTNLWWYACIDGNIPVGAVKGGNLYRYDIEEVTADAFSASLKDGTQLAPNGTVDASMVQVNVALSEGVHNLVYFEMADAAYDVDNADSTVSVLLYKGYDELDDSLTIDIDITPYVANAPTEDIPKNPQTGDNLVVVMAVFATVLSLGLVLVSYKKKHND